ncbi:MAG TPA: J domain-containing protein [Candidatus Paceibacterota bacterium]|nr:J domain-containing protein [Candidatus Paceibacterota bacterium]
MHDPVEGVDYLVDHYSILEVPRDSTQEQIEEAFRTLLKQYHPDRLHGLAPTLVGQAQQKTRLLTVAKEVLTDPKKREEYDSILAGWEKPISKHGEVIIDLTSKSFSLGTLLGALAGDDAREQQGETLALQFSSFNPVTYELINEQMQSTKNPPPKLKQAYQEQVAQRDLYLSLKEGFLWEGIGLNGAGERDSTLDYVEQVDAEVSALKGQALRAVEQDVLLLAAGKRALLSPPAGLEKGPIDAHKVLAHYTARIGEHFEKKTEAIRSIAQERQELLNTRFEHEAEVTYHPKTLLYTSDLIVQFRKKGGDIVARMAFKYVGNNSVVPNDEIEVPVLDDEGLAQEWIDKGFTIVSFTLVGDIEIKSQLHRVIDLHGAKLLENK